jgi:RHS repeat-associated protein
LDASGNALGQQGHLPFGDDFGESGQQEKHHFTSYERDAETGLDYAVSRPYSSVAGRFLSADPYKASGHLVDPQSWDRYAYTRNNPANRIDRSGMEDEPPDPGPQPGDTTVHLQGSASYNPEVPDWSRGTGLFIDGGFGQILAPNLLPVPDIPPPPPPQINSTKDLKKYWPGIKDWIQSKGKCGQKLASELNALGSIIDSGKINIIDLEANPDAFNTTLPDGTTVAAWFASHTADALTVNYFLNDANGTRERSDIYLTEPFYGLSAEEQGIGVFHELLHALYLAGDDELGQDLGMSHDDIKQWIVQGCLDKN